MQNRFYKILITGGESGIGAALTKGFSSDGHSIIICGLRDALLSKVAKTCKNVRYRVCDVSNEQDVASFSEFVREKFDCIDVIVNCAGIYGAIGRFDKTDSKSWKKAYETNLFGTYLITKKFLDLLLQSDIKKIVNFAGGGAFGPLPNYSAYAVSKTSVVRLSESIASELAVFGVRVNCVAPGFVATEIHNATLEAGEGAAGEGFRITMEKLRSGSVPMDVVVNCVKFLVSPESDGLTGKTISVSFDKWNTSFFKKSINQIVESELYTLRRINPRN